MNSTTKGSLAAAVAALLLTGGAGTLAYWSDPEATVTVTFNGPAATNASENLTATLNSVAVTATQNHDRRLTARTATGR
jgi:predicted ribosomally synthesized peptide with SipW-like signal peptide